MIKNKDNNIADVDDLYYYIVQLYPDSTKQLFNDRKYQNKNISIFFGKWLINFNSDLFTDDDEKLELIDTEQFIFQKDKMFYDELTLKEFLEFLKKEQEQYGNLWKTKTGTILRIVK